MNWLDIGILVMVGGAALTGLVRGLVREVASLVALILAVVIAGQIHPVGVQAVRLISARFQLPPPVAFAVAFVVVYLGVISLGFLIRRLLVYPLGLRWMDSLGGLLFGCAKGLTLAMALLLVAVAVGVKLPISHSQFVPYTLVGARLLAEALPSPLHDQLTDRLDRLERMKKPVKGSDRVTR